MIVAGEIGVELGADYARLLEGLVGVDRAVETFALKLRELQEGFRTGRLSQEQFGGGLRTLQADLHELAATTAPLREMEGGFKAIYAAGMTWTEFLKANMGPAMKEFGGHGAAIKELGAQWRAFSSGAADAVRATSDLGVTGVRVTTEVQALQQRADELTQAWHTGAVVEGEYGRQLRQLQADIREMASATKTGSTDMAALAEIGGRVDNSLRAVSRRARQSISGFEAVGVGINAVALAGTRGAAGIASASGALQMMAMGNPALIGILGGLGALAMAWHTITNAMKETEDQVKNTHDAMRERMRLIGAVGADASVRQLENLARSLRSRAISEALRVQIVPPEQVETIRAAGGVYRTLVTNAFERNRIEGQNTIHIQNATEFLRDAEAVESRITVNLREQTRERQRQLITLGAIIAELPQLEALTHGRGFALAPNADLQTMLRREGVEPPVIAPPPMDQLFDPAQLEAQMRPWVNALQRQFRHIRRIVMDGADMLVPILSGIGEQIGMMLAGITRGFKGFGQALLAVIGGVLVRLGQTLVAFGTAGRAILSFVTNPIAAIAVGVGLIALGTALAAAATATVSQGLAGGGGGGGGGASGAAVSGPAGGSGAGTLTIIFPASGYLDPHDPRVQDWFASTYEMARERRVVIERG